MENALPILLALALAAAGLNFRQPILRAKVNRDLIAWRSGPGARASQGGLSQWYLRLTAQGGSSDEFQPPANRSVFAFGLIFMWRHFGSQNHPAHKEGDDRQRQQGPDHCFLLKGSSRSPLIQTVERAHPAPPSLGRACTRVRLKRHRTCKAWGCIS